MARKQQTEENQKNQSTGPENQKNLEKTPKTNPPAQKTKKTQGFFGFLAQNQKTFEETNKTKKNNVLGLWGEGG